MEKWTPEQLNNQKSRAISDAELLKGSHGMTGGEYVQDEGASEPRLEVLKYQIGDIKEEHKKDVKKENELRREEIARELSVEILGALKQENLPEFPMGKMDKFNTNMYLSSEQAWLKHSLMGRKDNGVGYIGYGGPRSFTISEHLAEDSNFKSDIITIWCDNVTNKLTMSIRGIDLMKIDANQREEIRQTIIDAVKQEVADYIANDNKFYPPVEKK